MNKWRINQSTEVLAYYNIGAYSFFLSDNTDGSALEEKRYDFSIEFNIEIDNASIFTTLQASESFEFLCEDPQEISKLISNYENNVRSGQATLFWDTHKKYVIPVRVECVTPDADVAFIAYNIYENENEVEFVIKAFCYEAVAYIYNAIIEELGKFGAFRSINSAKHIKSLKLDELKVSTKADYSCRYSDKLLEGTIENPVEYASIFKSLIDNGYIDKSHRLQIERVLTQSGRNKFLNVMDKVLLLPIEQERHVMLHDSVPNNILEDDSKTVYTLNPRIWQYFMNRWFEEFVMTALQRIKADVDYDISIDFDGGGEYNFFETQERQHETEIDWIVTLKKGSNSKLVFIECKRTLSNKNITKIRKKWEEKLLCTKNFKFVDSFISLGYFSTVTNLKERTTVKAPNGHHIPMISYTDTNLDSLVDKLKMLFTQILDSSLQENES